MFMPTDMIVGQLADPRRAGVREGRRSGPAGHAAAVAHRSELHRHAAGVGLGPHEARGRASTSPSRSRAATERAAGHDLRSSTRTSRARGESPGGAAAAGLRGQGPGRRPRRRRRRVGDDQGHRSRSEPNALTVPIAAVKQNGSGDDVVRVIDLDRGRQGQGGPGRDRPHRGLVHRDHEGTEGRRDRDRRGRPEQ